VRVDRSILSTYTDFYQLTPTLSITISLENGQLMSQATHQRKIPLLPESRSKFFTKDVDAQLEFFPTEAGQISYSVLHQNGQDMRGERRP
jgi:hypothetical protein